MVCLEGPCSLSRLAQLAKSVEKTPRNHLKVNESTRVQESKFDLIRTRLRLANDLSTTAPLQRPMLISWDMSYDCLPIGDITL